MSVGSFVGVLAAAVAAIVAAVAFGGKLIRGENGYSLSKLQLLVWTLAAAVSYLLYLGELLRRGSTELAISASPNLLLLVGLSAGSYVTAGGIRAYQDQKGVLVRRPDGAQRRWRTLISDNLGNPDLSKIQLLVWTVVALTAYLAGVIQGLPELTAAGRHKLPEVSDMLVALMGVSQATYISKKAVSDTGAAASGGSRGGASGEAKPADAARGRDEEPASAGTR